MKRILFIALPFILFSCHSHTDADCKIILPSDAQLRQMKDESWIIVDQESYGLYYFVKNNHIDNSGWIHSGYMPREMEPIHYSDSCSAKADFKSYMDHKHLK